MKKNESKLVKYTLIAICLIFVFLFLVLPLYIVFAEAFRDGIEKYREAVTDKYTISAVLLTLEATVFAVYLPLGRLQSLILKVRNFLQHLLTYQLQYLLL